MHGSSLTKGLWNVNAVGLAHLLKGLPPKPVSDVLFYSFLVGLRPIHPLIHLPTFREMYVSFWRWCANSDRQPYNPQLIDDPTFVPLLFSVLYCGAIVAPFDFWAGPQALKGLDKDTTVCLLKTSYLKALDHCQYTRRPTLNSLVALLLGHSCSKPDGQVFDDLAFVGTVVRIAQTMGLHREYHSTGPNALIQEMHRRIWWHILYLDAQYAFQYGTQTCCGVEGMQWNTQTASEASDEAVSDIQPRSLASTEICDLATTSPLMLFTLGRYETGRFLYSLLNRVNSCERLTQSHLDQHFDSFKALHRKLKGLISRLPAQGIPEKGFIPSRIANASMLTHESLYTDQSEEPTVFSSWARISLTILAISTLITLQKAFLNHPSVTRERGEKLWTK